jgi:hypothetical protein
VPGGAAGLQNQSGGRKAPGGFDSLPSPPPSLGTTFRHFTWCGANILRPTRCAVLARTQPELQSLIAPVRNSKGGQN